MKKAERKFWEKVDKTQGCWLWTGARTSRGYGAVGEAARGAHRISWEMAKGEIPAGMFVCHSCDTPLCVNPSHLFLGTPRDNAHDMTRKGRGAPIPGLLAAWRKPPLGESHGSSKVTVGNVLDIRRLYRAGKRQAAIGRRFGISAQQVSNIVSGRNWSHVTESDRSEP